MSITGSELLTFRDTIAGDDLIFKVVENREDAREAYEWAIRSNVKRRILALDTEATHYNCYLPGWRLRTFQFGNANRSYVLPAGAKSWIYRILTHPAIIWAGHNGPHDIRSLDRHLGIETGVVCAIETFIPAHHHDSRNAQEGGVNHGLKEQSIAHIDPNAGKWEKALKEEFKRIQVPIPGEVYKSGPRKGQPKMRKAKLAEGWGLIDPRNPAYLAYAASDPILTYRLFRHYRGTIKEFKELYDFDLQVQQACDRLHRRRIPIDVPYLLKLRKAMARKIEEQQALAEHLGLEDGDIYSNESLIAALTDYGIKFTKFTPKTRQPQMTDDVLKGIVSNPESPADAVRLVQAVLTGKRLSKRRSAYVDQMLNNRDEHDGIHPSIKSLGARTARMSVSDPALQQLPTKDNEEEG